MRNRLINHTHVYCCLFQYRLPPRTQSLQSIFPQNCVSGRTPPTRSTSGSLHCRPLDPTKYDRQVPSSWTWSSKKFCSGKYFEVQQYAIVLLLILQWSCYYFRRYLLYNRRRNPQSGTPQIGIVTRLDTFYFMYYTFLIVSRKKINLKLIRKRVSMYFCKHKNNYEFLRIVLVNSRFCTDFRLMIKSLNIFVWRTDEI